MNDCVEQLLSWDLVTEDGTAVFLFEIDHGGGPQNHTGSGSHEVLELETRRAKIGSIESLRVVERLADDQAIAQLKPTKGENGQTLAETKLQGNVSVLTKLMATVLSLQRHPGNRRLASVPRPSLSTPTPSPQIAFLSLHRSERGGQRQVKPKTAWLCPSQ